MCSITTAVPQDPLCSKYVYNDDGDLETSNLPWALVNKMKPFLGPSLLAGKVFNGTYSHLPYDLLSDEKLEFVKEMKMPVFEWEGQPLIKRCTLVLRDGKVEHVWYPVFPPNENSAEVAAWLKASQKAGV